MGDVVEVKCKAGYSLTGSTEGTCQGFGNKYSFGKEPKCLSNKQKEDKSDNDEDTRRNRNRNRNRKNYNDRTESERKKKRKNYSNYKKSMTKADKDETNDTLVILNIIMTLSLITMLSISIILFTQELSGK